MSSLISPGIFDAAMDEIADRSKSRLYQRDYLAWASDVLGRRYYEKMAGIMVEAAHPSNGKIRNAIKSANGCGKSFAVSDLGVWWVTAFPPEESLALFSANGRDQIKSVIFKYLKDAYGYMATQAKESGGPRPIGWISEQLEWNYQKPDGSGKEAIAIGKRPADTDIVSAFQGTRKYRTLVGLDEMGGLPEDLYTAAEAVMTGEDSRILGIGNPDRRATPFFNLFTNEDLGRDWNLHTISAYELPTMTGEIVYPDDPDKQAGMLKGLTSKKWIAHKERAWMTGGDLIPDEEFPEDDAYIRRINGTPNGRFKAKVLGEFPGDADNTFFPEDDINRAHETEIEPDRDDRPVLGVDIATTGEDESVVYVNHGMRVRLFDKTVSYADGKRTRETSGVWSKEDELTAARRVHAIARFTNAREVRIDAGGIGSSVATYLLRSEEFEIRDYDVIRIKGAESSNDKFRWQIYRDEIHDYLRMLMHDGLIDLDPADTQLKDELMLITYTINDKGAIKIDKKRDMRTVLGGSPDRADAAMYAVVDASALIDNPYSELSAGDQVSLSPWAMLEASRLDSGYPV